MEEKVEKQLELLISRYPELSAVKDEIKKAYQILENCYANGGKLLIAGYDPEETTRLCCADACRMRLLLRGARDV